MKRTTTTVLLLCLSIPMKLLHAQYCNPLHRDQYVEPILNGVSMGSISNTDNGYPLTATGYSDYTSQSTDLTVGSTYNLSVQCGAAFQYNYAAWIDYNHDHEFEDNEKIGNTIVLHSYATGTLSFTVPPAAYNGITRMRVRATSEPYGPWDHSTDPCAPWEAGEAEDYSVSISGGLDNNIALTEIINPVSGSGIGAEPLKVTIKNPGNTDASGFTVSYSINGGAPVTENFNDTLPPDSVVAFEFSSSYDFSSHDCYGVSAWVTWSIDQTLADDTISASICHTSPVSGSGVWYLASGLCSNLEPLGASFGSTTNHTCMDDVFGAGNWNAEAFENVNTDSVFSTSTCLVFIDGSSEGEASFQTFVSENKIKMENWVASGGHLFLNCSNDGAGALMFNLGFGNVNMIASYETSYAIPYDSIHPIFSGPYVPVLDEWGAFYFSFSALYGEGLSTLMADNDDDHFLSHELNIPLLAGKPWGNGYVIFGTLVPSQLVTPSNTAMNSRRNVLAYLHQCSVATGNNSGSVADSDALSVFPNPAFQEVFIHSGVHDAPFVYSLSDMSGKKILNEETIPSGVTEFKLDVSSLAEGVYLLHMNSDGKIMTRKIAVTK